MKILKRISGASHISKVMESDLKEFESEFSIRSHYVDNNLEFTSPSAIGTSFVKSLDFEPAPIGTFSTKFDSDLESTSPNTNERQLIPPGAAINPASVLTSYLYEYSSNIDRNRPSDAKPISSTVVVAPNATAVEKSIVEAVSFVPAPEATFYAKGGGKPGSGGGSGGSGGGSGGGDTSGGTTIYSTYNGKDGGDPAGYDFDVTFSGSLWTADLQKPFLDTVDLLEASFIDINTETSVKYRGTKLDDLTVNASITQIDGVGNILGQAGPTLFWTSAGTKLGQMPAQGIIEFDQADASELLAQGLFEEVVLHESLHVMGFGTMWQEYQLLELNEAGQVNIYEEDINGALNYYAKYTGIHAVQAFNELFDDDPIVNYIKVEADGEAGTALGHWDEETYRNELMTGYLGPQEEQAYFSTWSAASLLDIGYKFSPQQTAQGFANEVNQLIIRQSPVTA